MRIRDHHHPAGDPHRAMRGRTVGRAVARIVVGAKASSPRHPLVTLIVAAPDRTRQGPRRPAAGLRRIALCLAVAAQALAGCANGDFGRVKPSLVSDNIHSWVGVDAARAGGVPISAYPLTDDEKQLRDLAYPLIEPAYERQRWYSILNEYGLTRVIGRDWCYYSVASYERQLMATPYRSATARYSRLNEDIRNDVTRMPQFVSVAQRVLDMDRKREKSLGYVAGLTADEAGNATARVAENALVIAWVEQSLVNRAATYRYALERLVIATPAPMAVEVERSLTLFATRIAEGRLLAGAELVAGGTIPAAAYPPLAASRRVVQK
jgi:hypothetical protein